MSRPSEFELLVLLSILRQEDAPFASRLRAARLRGGRVLTEEWGEDVRREAGP